MNADDITTRIRKGGIRRGDVVHTSPDRQHTPGWGFNKGEKETEGVTGNRSTGLGEGKEGWRNKRVWAWSRSSSPAWWQSFNVRHKTFLYIDLYLYIDIYTQSSYRTRPLASAKITMMMIGQESRNGGHVMAPGAGPFSLQYSFQVFSFFFFVWCWAAARVHVCSR